MTRARLPLVLLCFFLSGFAALLYETAWTREFALVFGTSDLAVASVLAAYMAGLAAGARLAGRLAHRIRRPVLSYGLLELGIALAALAVPVGIDAATALLVVGFGGLDTLPAAGALTTSVFYLASSFGILLLPTALMGATLPLLARYAVERESQIGSRVGLLYATNTAGAVAGTLTAAFALLPELGLRRTVWTGAALNGAVFLAAALLARGLPALPRLPTVRPRAGSLPDRSDVVLPLILVSGIVSFTYEVLWTRLLGHVLGGSVYAFATMLASFLLGIAAGSAVGSRLATTRARAASVFALAQLGAAGLSYVAFGALDLLPLLAQRLGAGAGAAALAPNVAVAGCVLLPAALCIGATFPLAVRILARHEDEAGSASARVYAWNTLGAIVGAVGAGFWAIPTLGYAGTLAAAAATNLALAGAACVLMPPRRRAALALVAVCALGLALAPPRTPWGLLRASPLSLLPSGGEAAYLGVGRASTVLLLELGGRWQLRSNGLPEALIQAKGGRPALQRAGAWLGALPAMARPEARSMLVIGLGGGVALEQLPASLAEIDVVELEPEVIAANRRIANERRADPLADPRVRITVNDARSALALTQRRYDAVVSQPSHPWTSGASHLYTSEFLELVRDRLLPGGVFVQWIGLEYVDRELFGTILATLAQQFGHVRVYRPLPSELLFLASDTPIEVESSVVGALAVAQAELAAVGVYGPEDVAAAFVLDEEGTRALAAGAPPNTDDANRLAMRSPRILGAALGAAGADELLAAQDPLLAGRRAREPVLLVRRLLARNELARAERVATALADPVARDTARGNLALARGRRARAASAFAQALARDPTALEARAGLLRARREALLAGDDRLSTLAGGLDEAGAAVVAGWRRQQQGGPAGLRALDVELAAVGPQHPFYADALRLRAVWRLESGDAADAREALVLLDTLVGLEGQAGDLVRRARAAAGAGYPASALVDLADVAEALERASDPRNRSVIDGTARAALRALRELPLNRTGDGASEQLRRRFEVLLR